MHAGLLRSLLETVHRVFPMPTDQNCKATHSFMLSHGGEGAMVLLQVVWQGKDGKINFYSLVFGDESISQESLTKVKADLEKLEEYRIKADQEAQIKLLQQPEDFTPPVEEPDGN